jgi:hypothetical protein
MGAKGASVVFGEFLATTLEWLTFGTCELTGIQ